MKWLVVVFFALSCFFGYLSYTFYEEKGVVQTALISCQESNRSLGKTIEKQEQEAALRDSVLSEYEAKQQQIQNAKCKSLRAISNLPSRANNEEINIDSKLPVELKRLLQQPVSGLSGKVGSDAGKPSQ